MSRNRRRRDSTGEDRSRLRGRGLHDVFNDIAARVTDRVGSPVALVLAVAVIVVWAITGPIFRFSDTWQLVINTGTTIVTFLMVFVIQTSQNRDSQAVHLKLDELIRALEGARDEFITTEEATEETVQRRAQELNRLAEQEAKQQRSARSVASGADSHGRGRADHESERKAPESATRDNSSSHGNSSTRRTSTSTRSRG